MFNEWTLAAIGVGVLVVLGGGGKVLWNVMRGKKQPPTPRA